MTHAKRLSINQYKADLSAVFRLGYTSCRTCMGISVSIYYYLLSIYYYMVLKKNENRDF